MENNCYLPPDAWICNERQNYYQHKQQEIQPTPYLKNDTTTSPGMDEPEVEWDQWVEESAFTTDQPAGNPNNWTSHQPESMKVSPMMATLDAAWLDEQLADPMAECGSTSMIDADELDELENILFSSPESSQQTYTSTPTSSENNHSSSSPSTSPENSQSTPTSSSGGLQNEDGLYSCPSCPKTFPKRHLLNRHLKNHNPAITCPHCSHRTARNRDMTRHITVHHPPPAAPDSPATHIGTIPSRYFCHVAGCVSNREGFTRRDNLGRHLKNAHKLRLSEIGRG